MTSHPAPGRDKPPTPVIIMPMRGERAQEAYPAIRGLPTDIDVFVVVAASGMPVLVTDTHAEAMRQVAASHNFFLAARH